MSEFKVSLPGKDQMVWPMLIVSLVMGTGSAGGLIERWDKYQTAQEAFKEEVFSAKGALAAGIAENSRQNGVEWSVFSRKINHLEERVVYLEGKLGVIHPHEHAPLSKTHPEAP